MQSISCRTAADNLAAAVSEALETAKPQSGPRVLMISAHVDSTLSGSAEGLSAELQQLLTVAEALEALEQRFMFVYATKAAAAAPSSPKRRVLQSGSAKPMYTGFGPYQECGQLCRVSLQRSRSPGIGRFGA